MQAVHIISIIIAVLFSRLVNAQVNPDSLLEIWKSAAEHDTSRLKAFDSYIWEFQLFSVPDSAFLLAEEQYEFALERKQTQFMAQARNLQAISFDLRGDYESALKYFGEARALYSECGNGEGEANALNNLGNISADKGDLVKALDYYLASLKIKEELNYIENIPNTVINIAGIYSEIGDYEEARTYCERGLEVAKEVGNRMSMANAYNGLGIVESKLGNKDLSIEHYKQCLTLFEELEVRRGAASVRINLGQLYHDKSEFEEARKYYEVALEIYREQGDMAGVSTAYSHLAALAWQTGDKNTAEQFGDSAFSIASDLELAAQVEKSSRILYQVFRDKGDFSKALEMHEAMKQASDKTRSDETRKEIVKQQFQYEFNKREALLLAEQEKKDALAAESIKRKNLQRNASVIGLLLASVVAFVINGQRRRIRREKQRSEELLLNILPAETAAELKLKGESEARFYDDVTVLFTDFSNFTGISEALGPRQLVAEINECFSAFDAIMTKHGVEKIKTIGDAYMAVGGLPSPHPQHAASVLMAALEVCDFMLARRQSKEQAGETYFEIRIGVHSGPVVAGIVGIKKFQYDIWGDTVNTASRMESSGDIGKVNISQSTWEWLKDDTRFRFTARGKIHAKGKGDIEMFFAEIS